jgi:hypothetical protein
MPLPQPAKASASQSWHAVCIARGPRPVLEDAMSVGWYIVTVIAVIVLPFVAAWLTLAELNTQQGPDDAS